MHRFKSRPCKRTLVPATTCKCHSFRCTCGRIYRFHFNSLLVLNKKVTEDKQLQRTVDYNINVIYATSVQESGVVSATIVFDSFNINHMAEYDFYTGWMTFADIGGVVILVTVMHSVVMFFLSCCVDKNSKVLASVHKDSTYHSVGQEGF